MRALSADEQRELNETADLFEMIAATNPSDVSALESLVEIYTKLGNTEKLARVNSRLGAAPAPARKAADAPPKAASAKATKRHLLPLGELLAANGLITREQLAEALKVQRTTKEKLGVILVHRNLITEDELIGFLSRQYSIPSVTLAELDVSPGTLRLVPAALAKK